MRKWPSANDQKQDRAGGSSTGTPPCHGGEAGSIPARRMNLAVVTQLAECRSSKPDGVGSRPTRCFRKHRAAVAQVAERRSRKAEVAGSWPACGSGGGFSGQDAGFSRISPEP